MLKIIIMTTSMLPLYFLKPKMAWMYSSSILMIISTMSMKLMFSPALSMTNEALFIADSLSTPLASLSIWISALMILASMKIMSLNNSPKPFFLWVIVLLIILLLAFYANNMLLFYLMFESSLIPILFLILGWGYQPERLQAGMYLMMYTILASLPLLISILMWMSKSGHTYIISPWSPNNTPPNMSMMWWYMSTAAFLVKLPLFLTHLWLPKAHVEAPVAGSMILAAILLKLGGFGLMRMLMTTKMHNYTNSSLITSISMCGAVITSMICLRQPDLKALIAYSSVGHMGLLIAGTMSLTKMGNSGAMSMMIAHGLSSSALFAISNMSYETSNTRSLYLSKGMSMIMPYMTMWWFLLAAANMAAPPTINLLSEILLIMSIMSFSPQSWILLAMTSFLSAAYSLYLYTASQHGTIPQFTNPMNTPVSLNSSIIILHALPIILLISKPELVILS